MTISDDETQGPTTYVLIHGGGDVGWTWHLVEAELRARGHRTVAVDLPIEDDGVALSRPRELAERLERYRVERSPVPAGG